MTIKQRHALVQSYLGKTVKVEIDRPIGYLHCKGEKKLLYPINYGYIPGVLGGDGEELDVYVLGPEEPIERFEGWVVGIVYRSDDVEDKLIAAPLGQTYTAEQIEKAIHFQEKYYTTTVQTI